MAHREGVAHARARSRKPAVNSEKWGRAKALFQAALELAPDERAAFVDAAVQHDEELRREVQSLLRADAAGISVLDRLPMADAAVIAAGSGYVPSADGSPFESTLGAGHRIGPYTVTALLGAGAMGQVYRARDPKLNRDVALKVLPAVFAADADRLVRFKREAQMLAALNHPNIAAIYGFEDAGSEHALVLELVDGPTLAEVIARGPLPLDETLTIARQIADALEAAHDKGIIHRDLKPANIKIASHGPVKVLDFGLAKVWEGAPGTLAVRNPDGDVVSAWSGGDSRDSGLHESRTSSRKDPGQADGHLVVWLCRLRDAHGSYGIRRRDHLGHHRPRSRARR